MPERCAIWKLASNAWDVRGTTVERVSDSQIQLQVEAGWPVDATYTATYTVFGSGDVVVNVQFETEQTDLPELPRFGMQMTIPEGFEQFEWYGRGPQENYWDRKQGARVGVYTGTVDQQFTDYSQPQENGNKTDVRWASFMNKEAGVGLLAVGMETLSVSAWHYTMGDLEEAEYTHQMPYRKYITVNLDYKQTGVGGDNSWGARPHEQFTLWPDNYSYSYRLRPISENQDPSDLSNYTIR